jgi:serine/threonine protein kinase
MLKLLNCAQGHYWEQANGGDEGAAEVCPKCGCAAESMPMFDLAPSQEIVPATAEPPPPLPLRDAEGRPIIAGYEIVQALGVGPTGVSFFRARQIVVNRNVILKVVFAKEDPRQLAWGCLRNEASALGKLVHPNIVQIFDAGERERQLFYNAVEDVAGPTLAEQIDGRPLPIRAAMTLVETLARAVHQAHQNNILHRNLKPASILFPEDDGNKDRYRLAKITDFGLARKPVEGDPGDVELQGELPCWLSPEQAWGRAKEIGPATDVYALGAILYQALSGIPPFREATASATLDAIQCREPARLARLPHDLSAICFKCLAKQPRRRYDSALALAEDLRRCAEGLPIEARFVSNNERLGKWVRRNRHAIAFILLGLMLGGLLVWMTMHRSRPDESVSTFDVQKYRHQITQLTSDLQTAVKQKDAAEYLRYLLLAQRAMEGNGNTNGGLELLSRCPSQMRSWEWHYLNGRLHRTLGTAEFSASMPILCIAVSEDARYLAAGGGNEKFGELVQNRGEVLVWDLESRKVVRQWKLTDPVRSLAFDQKEGLAVVCSGKQSNRSGTLQMLDLRTGRPRFPPRSFGESKPTSVMISQHSQTLIVMTDDAHLHILRCSGGAEEENNAVLLWRPGPREPLGRLVSVAGSTFSDSLAMISPDGGQAVLISDVHSPNPPIYLQNDSGIKLLSLAYDRVGNVVAAGATDKNIHLYHPNFTNRLPDLRGHQDAVTGLSFSGDGKRLASCGRDGTVRLWNMDDGLELLTISGYPGASAVLFRPDPSSFPPGNAADWAEVKPERLFVAHENKVTMLAPPRLVNPAFGK